MADPAELFLLVGPRCLGLVAMLVIGSLSWDVCRRLRSTEFEPLLRSSRSAATIGLAMWGFFVMLRVDWGSPWPMHVFPFTAQTFHLFVGAILARALSGFLAMILCFHASAACSRELARLERERIEKDPFRSRSELA